MGRLRRRGGYGPIGPWILIGVPDVSQATKRNGKIREAMGPGSTKIAFSFESSLPTGTLLERYKKPTG